MPNLQVIYLYDSFLVHLCATNAKCNHFKYLYKFHCELTCIAPRLGKKELRKKRKQTIIIMEKTINTVLQEY